MKKLLLVYLYTFIASVGVTTAVLLVMADTEEQPDAGLNTIQAVSTTTDPIPLPPPPPVLRTYIEIIEGCYPHIGADCTYAHSGPDETYRKVAPLRIGAVLLVDEAIQTGTSTWYKIKFDEFIRYPERVTGTWHVPGDAVRIFKDVGLQELDETTATTSKHIIVDRSDQMLYAYDGDMLFLAESISTGLTITPTPRGTFTVFRKTPSRYMQGPLPGISAKYYDLPGVPWNLYFTHQGAVVHGAYWHDEFGKKWSSGCVNLPSKTAERLYHWAELGMTVVVRD